MKIGVDGGGTKTECILVDARGEVVARHLAPGCNPSQVGPERARAVLQEALPAIAANAPTGAVDETLLCMAGNRAFWRDTAAALQGYGRVRAVDDSLPVLELATSGSPGLVLHAGTGSFVAARAPDGSVHYAGGLGWKFGDAGSGFDLGRRALALALLELQAAAPGAAASPLVAALCTHTGLADYAANSRFFYNDEDANAKIASFAPVVLDLAARDNGPAQQVVADSVTELARLADQVIHRLFPSPAAALPCGVSGRVLNSVPAAFALRSLASKLRWPVELRFINAPPSEGVRRLLVAGR
ncbi:MAG TPA: BadF/BadG/BcrA/BcrD ATPase family protein [Lacunisphaera sp.]|nr:BadF/BadG/BcrA/BcrD ATPase family protein [Lacunisphaera sp.]